MYKKPQFLISPEPQKYGDNWIRPIRVFIIRV